MSQEERGIFDSRPMGHKLQHPAGNTCHKDIACSDVPHRRTTTSVRRDILSGAVIRGSFRLKLQKKLPMMLGGSGLKPWFQGSLSELKSGYNYASFVFRRYRARNLVEAN